LIDRPDRPLDSFNNHFSNELLADCLHHLLPADAPDCLGFLLASNRHAFVGLLLLLSFLMCLMG
jgi:hypothetical protein